MIDPGTTAPTFTASLAAPDGELTTISLTDALADAPLVLAFFPAAFSGTCTDEMAAIEKHIDRFRAADATVYGVSVDLPWALAEFADSHDLSFGLIGDVNRDLVDAYDVELAFDGLALETVADRAVVVIDAEGVVADTWLADDPGQEPPYDDLIAAVERLRPAD